MEDKNRDISRRQFLKRLGVGTVSAAAMMTLGPIESLAREKQLIGKPSYAPLAGGMTYRVNRKTGDKVSLLGFGMMRLPSKNRQIDQEEVNKMVARALEGGVNYFDTSPHYHNGQSEPSLGTALKASGVPRKNYYIATKMSNFSGNEQTYEASVAMYKKSMELMQTDYIDYYLLHGIGMGGVEGIKQRFLNNGILEFLLKEREAGRIRNLGFSYHADIEAFDYLLEHNDEYKWDFVQIEMNYADWRHAKELNARNTNAEYLYSECEKRGIQTVMMEPLLGGRLANLNDAYKKKLLERRPNDSIASWAFRFCGTFPNVLTSLSGMSRMEHLEDNLKTHSPLDPCTSDELALLEDIAGKMVAYPTIPCTDCKYCMPCPYDVNIPANFAFYNTRLNNDTLPTTDKTSATYAEQWRKFQKEYTETVGEKALATNCVECEECLSKCPQRIRIPQQMTRLGGMLKREV